MAFIFVFILILLNGLVGLVFSMTIKLNLTWLVNLCDFVIFYVFRNTDWIYF